MFDVAIVGYGPISAALSLMLARQGRRVAVFERWSQRYALPRAVCIDHEMARMLGAIGLGDVLSTVFDPAPPYQMFSADWTELLQIDWSKPSISGGTEVNFVHQPTLEQALDDAVRRHPEVTLHLGCEIRAVDDRGDHATLRVRDVDSGNEHEASAGWVVGADGANSLVRRAIGGDQQDFGFQADWLVIDLLPNEGVVLDVPPAAQWCNPARPTTIVPAGVRDGRHYRRWEFMRLPGEDAAWLETEACAWELLSPWVRPDQASLVRHKLYNFRSLLAERWRRGRLLIAGDAAHVMPPFMGQGMCSGFRDAWNLAWKLALVLDGRAGGRLLDSYGAERRPHVARIIEMSMFVGRMVCIADPAEAAARDAAFLDGTAPPPPSPPALTGGLLDRTADGQVAPLAGQLCPHGRVRRGRGEGARDGRYDDLVGTGFALLFRDAVDPGCCEMVSTGILRDLFDGRVHHFTGLDDAADRDAGPGDALVDLDGRYVGFMDRNGLAAMVVRPDFHLFGTAPSASAVPALLRSLAHTLEEAGLLPMAVETAA